MPYGSKHDYVHKETNSQPGGREDSRAHTITGPAFTGAGAKTQKDMKSSGLGRPLRGKVPSPAGAKQHKG
jgi:hypothetical protein